MAVPGFHWAAVCARHAARTVHKIRDLAMSMEAYAKVAAENEMEMEDEERG